MGNQPVFLFLMLGFPGSGKTYVARWLGPEMQAVNLRSDDLRLHMFTENKLELHTNWKYQRQVHGAMQYAAMQVLSARHSVVYDANHNSLKSRRPMQKIAREKSAIPILVWVKTPLEVARQRVIERHESGEQEVFELSFVERMAANLQPPTGHELYIELDGTSPETEQRQSFADQLADLVANKVQ